MITCRVCEVTCEDGISIATEIGGTTGATEESGMLLAYRMYDSFAYLFHRKATRRTLAKADVRTQLQRVKEL